MTQQEWESATPEQQAEEYERCKDPVYLYNTYWVDTQGNKPPPVTHEQWNEKIKYAWINRSKSYRAFRRPEPMSINDCYLPDFIKPSQP